MDVEERPKIDSGRDGRRDGRRRATCAVMSAASSSEITSEITATCAVMSAASAAIGAASAAIGAASADIASAEITSAVSASFAIAAVIAKLVEPPQRGASGGWGGAGMELEQHLMREVIMGHQRSSEVIRGHQSGPGWSSIST